MTKLMEWLVVGLTMFIVWISVLVNRSNSKINVEWYIKFFPLICLFTFGLYSFIVVMYRTLTFNNCEEAAIELQNVSCNKNLLFDWIYFLIFFYNIYFQEIKEAMADLESKGIVLKNKTKQTSS